MCDTGGKGDRSLGEKEGALTNCNDDGGGGTIERSTTMGVNRRRRRRVRRGKAGPTDYNDEGGKGTANRPPKTTWEEEGRRCWGEEGQRRERGVVVGGIEMTS